MPSGASDPCGGASASLGEADAGADAGAAGPDASTPDAGPLPPPFDSSTWCSGLDPSVCGSKTVNDGTVTKNVLRDLINDQRYQFVLVAVDEAGNQSAGSDALDATPLVVQDFYRRYRCSGGTEKGGFGCSASSAALLLPGSALLVVALLRRRRRSVQGK
ncbi:MAG: hypothetical protein HY901_32635 [Deltaproteobacteria bacterium]|nr:hypothetical protein [Deltaproteobacteria bacterium]